MASLPTDVHLIGQMILYLVASLTGLVIAIPMAVTQGNFNGHCLLYTDLSWYNATFVFFDDYGNTSSCHFVLYIGVFCCTIYGLVMGLYYMYAVCKNRSNKDIAYEMWVMPFILSNALNMFLVFVAACVLSVGFSNWCSQVMDGRSKGSKIKSCSALEGVHVNRDKKHSEHFQLGHYFGLLSVAQAAVWLAVALWLAQVALGFLRMFRAKRRRSQETFQGTSTSDTQVLENPTA